MTDEEKQELEDLRAKDELDEAEQERLKELEDLELRDSVDDDDEFDKAFDEAVAEDDPGDTADEDGSDKDGDADSDKDKDQTTDDDDASDEDGSSKSIFKKPPEGEDQDKDKDKDADADDDSTQVDWEAKFKEQEDENKKLTQKMKSWEGRITAANRRAEEAESKLQEAEEKSTQEKSKAKKKADSLPDGDDDEVLKEFIEEFPSLERPIKALAMRMAKQVVESELKELKPKFEKIDDLEKTIEEDETAEHFRLIEEAHDDYKEIMKSGKLEEWIEAQPSFVKAGLEKVVQEGTAKEVIEMFDTYKESMGLSKPSKTQDQSGKKSKKAKDMMAVDGSPSKPNTKAGKKDKDDFDAAWDEAMADEK